MPLIAQTGLGGKSRNWAGVVAGANEAALARGIRHVLVLPCV